MNQTVKSVLSSCTFSKRNWGKRYFIFTTNDDKWLYSLPLERRWGHLHIGWIKFPHTSYQPIMLVNSKWSYTTFLMPHCKKKILKPKHWSTISNCPKQLSTWHIVRRRVANRNSNNFKCYQELLLMLIWMLGWYPLQLRAHYFRWDKLLSETHQKEENFPQAPQKRSGVAITKVSPRFELAVKNFILHSKGVKFLTAMHFHASKWSQTIFSCPLVNGVC